MTDAEDISGRLLGTRSVPVIGRCRRACGYRARRKLRVLFPRTEFRKFSGVRLMSHPLSFRTFSTCSCFPIYVEPPSRTLSVCFSRLLLRPIHHLETCLGFVSTINSHQLAVLLCSSAATFFLPFVRQISVTLPCPIPPHPALQFLTIYHFESSFQSCSASEKEVEAVSGFTNCFLLAFFLRDGCRSTRANPPIREITRGRKFRPYLKVSVPHLFPGVIKGVYSAGKTSHFMGFPSFPSAANRHLFGASLANDLHAMNARTFLFIEAYLVNMYQVRASNNQRRFFRLIIAPLPF